MSLSVVCDKCGRRKENVKLRERTDPRTFKRITARLCTPCARAEDWPDVNFERGQIHPLGGSTR